MKEVEELLVTDLEEYCKGNVVTDVRQCKTGVAIETEKSTLVFEGLTMAKFHSTHCSCIDIKRTHWTQVRDILRKCIIYSSFAYEDK